MPLSLSQRIKLLFFKIPRSPIKQALTLSDSGELHLTFDQLVAHHCAGGRSLQVVETILKLREAGKRSDFNTVCAADIVSKDLSACLLLASRRCSLVVDKVARDGGAPLVIRSMNGDYIAARIEISYEHTILTAVLPKDDSALHKSLVEFLSSLSLAARSCDDLLVSVDAHAHSLKTWLNGRFDKPTVDLKYSSLK